MVFYPLECLKKRATGLCYSSTYGSLTTALALNSLLVFINLMQLPGSRGDAVYLCVLGHTCLSETEQKNGKSTASWNLPCVKYFPVINSNKWIHAILKWLLLHDQGRTRSGNPGPGFQNCSGLKCLNLIRAGLSKVFESGWCWNTDQIYSWRRFSSFFDTYTGLFGKSTFLKQQLLKHHQNLLFPCSDPFF